MNDKIFANSIEIINEEGYAIPVPVKHRTVVPEKYDAPVLVVDEHLGRLTIEIRSNTQGDFYQIVEQIFLKLSQESNDIKSLSFDKWERPRLCGRIIIDY